MDRFYKRGILMMAVLSLVAPRIAFADAVSDGNTVASKLYVDTTSVAVNQGTGPSNANVGKTLVVNSSGNLELSSAALPNLANVELTTNKLDGASGNTIAANSSNTTKYTSAKSVADYAQPKTGSGDNYKLAGASGTWVALGTTLDSTANDYAANNAVTAATIVSALSDIDTTTHTVNGAPLSNSASYYYGESITEAATAQKEVSIPSITALQAGQIIAVKPTITSTVKNSTLKLNNFDAYPMKYRNANITTSTDSIVWYENTVSFFLFDGASWHFVAGGSDNTTYSAMSVSDGITGTATSSKLMRADYLKQIIQGTTLTGLDTATAGAVAATDTITEGIGKLEATKQTKPSTVANGQVLTYTGSDANANVSAAYIKVPVATGAPSSNTPTSMAEIWIQ